MLRVTWRESSLRPRVLSEEDFLREFEALASRDFVGSPTGQLLVEGLDAQHRVAWCGHYRSARELGVLVRQLREERAWREKRRDAPVG
jgi:hypothetical protein